MNYKVVLMVMVWWLCGTHSTLSIFTPVVKVAQGRLRGLRSVSGVNRYYSIPYATSKRYEPPKNPPKWKGVFEAVQRFSSCAQTVSFITIDTEDCHLLDVYTPKKAKPDDKLPVMVFFHGGAYYYGSKAHYDPEFLVTKNIVSVIINYRLSAFGFLCFNGVANLGLKDQTAALRWIKKNISAFGGDPDNVTIAGQSAGASAVAMHMLSDHSKGLFHKAILMSGSAFTPWAFNLEPTRAAFMDVKKMAKVNTEKEMYDVFANFPTRDILHATVGTSGHTRYFKYSPCMDSNLTEPFFRDTPYNIIKSGNFNKVPIITGIADKEGIQFYAFNDQKSFKDWDENFIERLPSVFSWCSKDDRKKIVKMIRKHYFDGGHVNSAAVKGVVEYYSDWINHATEYAVSRLLIEHSDQPVYNYMFSYLGERNLGKLIFAPHVKAKGTTHSDELFYIFKPGGISLILSNSDKKFIDRLTKMLANFMKYGDPTPVRDAVLPVQWRPSTANTSHVMRLDRTLRLTSKPWPPRGFFLDLLCTYGKQGYVPCESAEQCNLSGS